MTDRPEIDVNETGPLTTAGLWRDEVDDLNHRRRCRNRRLWGRVIEYYEAGRIVRRETVESEVMAAGREEDQGT